MSGMMLGTEPKNVILSTHKEPTFLNYEVEGGAIGGLRMDKKSWNVFCEQ